MPKGTIFGCLVGGINIRLVMVIKLGGAECNIKTMGKYIHGKRIAN